MNVLEAKGLTVEYENPILNDVNLSIGKGVLVGVLGANGAGKSTLLMSLMGMIKCKKGEIYFPDLKNKKLAYVPQTEDIDWDFPITVYDLVLMSRYEGLFKKFSKKELVYEKLELLEMKDYAKRQINELSGGQKQRVFIARALAKEANTYFLDEPFKGVDVKTEKKIIEILKNMRDEGKTIVVVHHDLKTVSDYFDEIILVNNGKLKHGKVDEIFTEENIKEAFQKRSEI